MRVSKHFRVFDYFLKCMQSFRPTGKMLVRDFEPRIDIKLLELLTKLTLIYREVIIYIYIYRERERERERERVSTYDVRFCDFFSLLFYSTPAKASKCIDLVIFKPYMWTNCEKKERDVGERNSNLGSRQRHDHH